MLLTELRNGEKAVISNIIGGRGVQKKLMDLGLLPGTSVEIVVRHPLGGPILLKVGGSQVALGRGIAGKIEVSPGLGDLD